MATEPLFSQFFLGGFECSSHRLRDGTRLDLIAATQHDRYAANDYQQLRDLDITAARDGIRWHLIEQQPGVYDWSSVLPMLRAARSTGICIIWDLCHYGWPEDLDILGPKFVPRFAAFARAFAELVAEEQDAVPFYAPINEISFFAWAAGDAGYLNPFYNGRSFELKVQLVRATLAAIDAIWQVDPRARIVHADPMIHVATAHDRPWEHAAAEGHRQSQFQSWDMISGQMWPQLGGHPRYLDIVGVNYYSNNQWIHGGPPIDRFHPQYRLFHELLREVYDRYQRPLFIAETGCENAERPEWLRYISRAVRTAIRQGVPVEGICLYPIANHPGWDDERHCHNGLVDYPNPNGKREVYMPLANELRAQQVLFAAERGVTRNRASTQATRATQPSLCLYTDSHDPSGMGEVMLTLAGNFRNDMQVSLVCGSQAAVPQLVARAAALGIESYALPMEGDHIATQPFCNWLRSHPVQIFHGHAGIGWEGHHAAYVAHAMGVPAVIRTEHLPYLLTNAQQQADHARLVTILDQLLCVSDEAHQTFLAAGVAKQQLRVIHNGVTLRQPIHTRRQVRAALSFGMHEHIILTVGRMTAQKGYDVLLAAVPAVLAAYPRTHFVWVGEGPLFRSLQAEVRASGLDYAVHIIGARADVPDLLAAADAFVLPSHFEGLPLVVLEAMAAGLPVIGTQVCGTSELVIDGVTGRLVPPAQPAALAAAIIALLSNPRDAAAWGTAGRARAITEFSVARMAENTLALYHELLHSGPMQRVERRVGFARHLGAAHEVVLD